LDNEIRPHDTRSTSSSTYLLTDCIHSDQPALSVIHGIMRDPGSVRRRRLIRLDCSCMPKSLSV